jgi:hypothetical protein
VAVRISPYNVACMACRTAYRKLFAALLVAAGCSNEHPREERPNSPYQPAPPAAEVTADQEANGNGNADGGTATLAVADWNQIHAAILARVDSVDKKLRRVPGLSREEKTRLRRDVNAIQIERARQLGVRAGSSVEQLVKGGQLVRLVDTTEHWIVRKLQYSAPYLTPSAKAMLVEIGERFHHRLDSMGLPRYRLDITSVLRTPENQLALRRANSNASRIESAHEFGTTVDVAYRRFAPPADDPISKNAPGMRDQVRHVSDSLMIETGRLRGGELQAILGRVIGEMQNEGKLMVRMERRQTVYHMTVARPFPSRARPASQ